jgi:molecular chaperone GrpE
VSKKNLLETGEGRDEESEDQSVEALRRELESVKKESQDLLTRLKYTQADFENYRKRVDKELKEAGEAPVRNLVSRLLVVLDEMRLAAKHAEAEGESGEIRQGIAMVERNLEAALGSVGVERIECVGKPFDPSMHEAVEKVEGGEEAEDIVVEELRPGFLFRGQLLRPSLVKVQLASKAAGEEEKADE